MLNRRSLRVKAMQALFAYGQCKEANYNIGLGQIDEAFLPDLNSMEVQDRDMLKRQRQQCKRVFAFKVNGSPLDPSEVVEDIAHTVANNAQKAYLVNIKSDHQHMLSSMINDAESLIDRFLEVTSLLITLADYSKIEADKRLKISPEKSLIGDLNFSKNKVIDFFRNSSKVQVALVKKNISWEDEEENYKGWFRDVLKKDEAFDTYRKTANPNFEDDKEIIDHIVKQVIFKIDAILCFFEERDIYWQENKAIARSLVSRSIRDLEEASIPKEFNLPDFSNNWEEDKSFFEKIFKSAIENDEEYSEIIAAKTKNWEVDRLAITDQIILKMAIAEMLNFQSIPVKVTINEYIELSKNYSTPKSKQFINGILDVISVELKTIGKLKKSGRGLMDNK
ncbi:MAG: N utilization substance protein B [Candidatus Endobugula sp.]|jgi:N utilization substance protein B